MENSYSSNLIENVIQNEYFSNLNFNDERERNVFLSYIRGFFPIVYDSTITNFLEIGGGQSTYILSHLARRANFKLSTIDMDPMSIKNRLRSLAIVDDVISNINFITGFSVDALTIKNFYSQPNIKIGNHSFNEVLKYSKEFINISMDDRKVSKVNDALGLTSFSFENIFDNLSQNNNFPKGLLSVFRTENDEFSFTSNNSDLGSCLKSSIKSLKPQVIFLDGGEFTSILEWNIVINSQQKGDYVLLHDIFFPKSFKNWLVAASIKADNKYKIIYVDKSTPQGFLVAKRILN